MASAIASYPVHTSPASGRSSPIGKSDVPTFTRQASSASSSANASTEISGIKDKGGIDPRAFLYDQIVAYANEALPPLTPGARQFREVALGLAPSPVNRPATNPLFLRNINNGIHASVYTHGHPLVLLHQVEFMPGANDRPQISVNGHVLSSMSSYDDLQLAAAVGLKIVQR
jgi:hypothetical protein